MAATTHRNLAEWQGRLADALKAAYDAMGDRASAAETARLDQQIRTLELEGRERGFLPADGPTR